MHGSVHCAPASAYVSSILVETQLGNIQAGYPALSSQVNFLLPTQTKNSPPFAPGAGSSKPIPILNFPVAPASYFELLLIDDFNIHQQILRIAAWTAGGSESEWQNKLDKAEPSSQIRDTQGVV